MDSTHPRAGGPPRRTFPRTSRPAPRTMAVPTRVRASGGPVLLADERVTSPARRRGARGQTGGHSGESSRPSRPRSPGSSGNSIRRISGWPPPRSPWRSWEKHTRSRKSLGECGAARQADQALMAAWSELLDDRITTRAAAALTGLRRATALRHGTFQAGAG